MLPVRVAALLQKHGSATYHPCEGAKFHSPRPLNTKGYSMPNNRKIYLCGTCHGNLSVYLFLFNKERDLDWPTRREFGNEIRALGDEVAKAGRK